MCDLVARTGRHQQRYEGGCRLIAGFSLSLFLSLATLFNCYQVDSFLFDNISSSSNSLQTMLVIGVGV